MSTLSRIGGSVALLAALAFGTAAPAHAQGLIATGSITATSADCSVANSCVQFEPGAAYAVSVAISGTWVATNQLECTADDPTQSVWVSVQAVNVATAVNATSTTANGTFSFPNAGYQKCRVRASAYTSGTARVAAGRGFATARLFSPYVVTLYAADGTCAAPSWTFDQDRDSGAARLGADDIGFCAGGTLRWDYNTARILSTLSFQGPDGTAASPTFRPSSEATGGYLSSAGNWGISIQGTETHLFSANRYAIRSNVGSFILGTAEDVITTRDAANIRALRNGTTAQEDRWYESYTDASNNARAFLRYDSGNTRWLFGAEKNGTGTLRGLALAGGGSAVIVDASGVGFPIVGVSTSAVWQINTGGDLTLGGGVTSGTRNIGRSDATATPGSLFLKSPAITVGSGTGITVDDAGQVRDLDYKVTVLSTAFVCAAVTCDVTIATLPAGTLLYPSIAVLNTTFACASVCTTSTLSLILGKGAGGAEYLASFDADAATGTFGDADAELGTLLTRAAAIGGGTYHTSSQAVVLRLTSGTGNIGNGSVTNLSQGSVTITLRTRVKA